MTHIAMSVRTAGLRDVLYGVERRRCGSPGSTGVMSLTVRRPLDAPSTGNVRLTVVYEVYGGGDGDVVLHVTPIAFHHGSGFETYGSVASESLIAASGNLMQQSIVIPSGLGFSPGGD